MRDGVIDRAAARLRAGNRAFSRRNLFHAVRRLEDTGAACASFERFVAGPLADRLRAGPVDGLLPAPATPTRAPMPSREWDAYFPAAVLMVDRREILELIVASGVIVHARLAVVCVDGSPAPVIDWLRRGLRAGHRAPFGYLHDAATVLYPFSLEPFATLFRVLDRESPEVVDLGLPPDGVTRRTVGGSRRGGRERVFELEAVEPATLISWAVRRLLALQPRDPWLEPLAPTEKEPTMIFADGGILIVGGIAAEELAARFGTPAYVYDADTVRATYRDVRDAFRHAPTRVHFAAVCNPNLHLLRLLRDTGAGLHANTPGDVFCGLRAGFHPEDIVFSGSNLSEADLRFLAGTGVAINVDSLDDLRRAVAVAPGRAFGVRIDLEDVLPESRIGLREHELDEALAITAHAGARLDAVHIYCGTHGRSLERYRRAITRLLAHAARLPDLACINLGGGFGYDYHDSTATFPFRALADIVEGAVAELAASRGRTLTLRAEPGRAIVAGAGVLLTRVLSVKRGARRRYIGVDTTVANFTSPAVHGRHRRVVAVGQHPAVSEPADLCGCTTYSRDVIAHDVPLGDVRVGDLVAVLDSGAYGYCMAGHFLNRPSPPEIFVDRGVVTVATRRETFEDLVHLQPQQ